MAWGKTVTTDAQTTARQRRLCNVPRMCQTPVETDDVLGHGTGDGKGWANSRMGSHRVCTKIQGRLSCRPQAEKRQVHMWRNGKE